MNVYEEVMNLKQELMIVKRALYRIISEDSTKSIEEFHLEFEQRIKLELVLDKLGKEA